MGRLEDLQEQFNQLNDEVKSQRNEQNRYRNDKATQTALQQRLATLQAWLDQQGYNMNVEIALDDSFNEFEYVHKDIIRELQDQIEALSGTRPILGE